MEELIFIRMVFVFVLFISVTITHSLLLGATPISYASTDHHRPFWGETMTFTDFSLKLFVDRDMDSFIITGPWAL